MAYTWLYRIFIYCIVLRYSIAYCAVLQVLFCLCHPCTVLYIYCTVHTFSLTNQHRYNLGIDARAALLCDAWTGTFSRCGGLDARRSYCIWEGVQYSTENVLYCIESFSNASYSALTVLYCIL